MWEFLSSNPALLWSATVVLGLIVGSFLNVVIYRLPIMLDRQWRRQCHEYLVGPGDLAAEPLVGGTSSSEPFNLNTPRSRCPQCGKLIRAWENIPVVSYLLLRGRCSGCGTRISPRYPLIEALTGLMSLIVVWHLGPTWAGGAGLLLTWALIALTFIDFDHQLLPDDITLPFLWLGLLISLFAVFTDLRSSLIGAIAGYLSLWSVYHLFRLFTGKEGMGYGDFKLLGVLGAWLGWQSLPAIILLSLVVGAVVGILLIVLRRHGRDIPIPFGPYLAGAGWLAMLWGQNLTDAYLRWSGIMH